MSWTAGRYRLGLEGADPNELTVHHVPPRHPWRRCRTRWFVLNIPRSAHDAYHHALGNPKTYEEACQILWERFWNPEGG